ncbi:hypothetical protein, partial [Duodenibacillus massiliensis]|uniref:hypothetical protein n=1 Tax=Duodenibacillus massiliensis TaxID=1852381 RepID=UPI003AF4C049
GTTRGADGFSSGGNDKTDSVTKQRKCCLPFSRTRKNCQARRGENEISRDISPRSFPPFSTVCVEISEELKKFHTNSAGFCCAYFLSTQQYLVSVVQVMPSRYFP